MLSDFTETKRSDREAGTVITWWVPILRRLTSLLQHGLFVLDEATRKHGTLREELTNTNPSPSVSS
jgi:hypothetical protein